MNYKDHNINLDRPQPVPPEVIYRLVACEKVSDEVVAQLEEPWRSLAIVIISSVMDQDVRGNLLQEFLADQEIGDRDDPSVKPDLFSQSSGMSTSSRNDFPYPPLPPGILPLMHSENRVEDYIDTYIRFAHQKTPTTPILFLESSALFLWSTLAARRLVLPMPWGNVYPNLEILWVARTTIHRKTTSLNIAIMIAKKVAPFLLAPEDATPEALLNDFAGVKPVNFDQLPPHVQSNWTEGRSFSAQKSIIRDEFSGLLANAGKDYNAGLIEVILKAIDCAESFTRMRTTQGVIELSDLYLPILAASTPVGIAPFLRDTVLFEKGFWPRFILLSPDSKPIYKKAVNADLPEGLVDNLKRFHKLLPRATYPDHPKPITVVLGDKVYEIWENYNRTLSYEMLSTPGFDQRLDGTYGRLPEIVLKVSMILAAMDWDSEPAPVIQLRHLVRAIEITEKWRMSAHRVLREAFQISTLTTIERVVQCVASQDGNGMTRRDIHKRLKNLPEDSVDKALSELVSSRTIIIMKRPTTDVGGRPTQVYKIASER